MTRDAATTPALLCPACGYDLRGAVEATRCSECGVEVDPARPFSTAWPWMRRGIAGPTIGYLLTTWWVAVGHSRLALEARKRQDLGAARSFRRLTAYLVAAALLGTWVCAWLAQRQRPFKLDPRWLIPENASGVAQEWAMPLSTGFTLAGVMPVMIMVLALRIAGAPARALRGGGGETGEAIGCYVAGMLSWLLLPAAAIGAYTLATWGVDRSPVVAARASIMKGIAWFIAAIVVLVIGWTGLWGRRLGGTGWIAMLGVAASWVWEAIIWLVMLPWGVGFLWIVWESMR